MCFSIQAIGTVLIWAIVIGAVLAILKLIVAFVLPKIGIPIAAEVVGLFTQILTILIWAFILIFVVVIVFDIIACLLAQGGSLPRLHGSLPFLLAYA
jgi:hypothetical protein